MRTVRYWFRVLNAFIIRFKRILLIGALSGGLVFFLLSRFPSLFAIFTPGDSIGVVGRYTIDELPISIQSDISRGLTTIDDSDNAKPSLATSWEPQDDGKSWLFHLGDFQWQDGTKVKAKDILYKFNDVTTQVIDDQTIKFSLKNPFSPFPTVVSRPVFKKGLLGTGGWKVVKFTTVQSGNFLESIELAKVNGTTTKTYRFYPTEEASRTALKLAEINKLEELIDPKDLKTWNNLEIIPQTKENLYVGVFINNDDPILSDKSARQALAYAINKDQFGGERAIGPIAPNSWAFNPQVKQYTYNIDRAKELLKNLPDDQRKDLTITLNTTQTLLQIADQIKTDWAAIGVNTNIQVSNTPTDKFQVLLAIQETPSDPDQYSFWHSTQDATNITNYHKSKESQRIDKLLEDGRRTLNQDDRKKIYLDFQRFLVEDCPVIFLYHPVTYTITKK